MNAKEKRAQELYDLKVVMDTPEGARFVWRLVNDICAYDSLLVQNSGSMTYMDLGMRNVGRIVKGEAYTVALEQYQALEREYMKAKMSEDENEETT